MGLPGRPNVPTAIKEARGTARPDRANPAEPTPATLEVGVKPPTWLRGPRRRRAWTELVGLLNGEGVLTVMDSAALAMLVDAYGDYLEASDLVAGVACGRCGLPVVSKVRCTATAVVEAVAERADEELEPQPLGGALKRRHRAEQQLEVIVLEHEPGRRYYTTRTKEGSLMIRPHPAMAVRQDAWKRVIAMLSRFGMDPSSRSKVSKTGSAEPDAMDDLLSDAG